MGMTTQAEQLESAEGRLRARKAALADATRKATAARRVADAARKAVAETTRTVKRLRKRVGPGAAIAEAARHLDVREAPPGSNRGGWVDRFQAPWGSARGYAWCGAFVGYCLRKAAVGGLTSRVLYVPFIIEDAKGCRGGFKGWVGKESIKAGDLVVMDFGGSSVLGEHVGLAIDDYDRATNSVRTIEGNTSSGNAGSQDNGGGVFRRARPAAVIVGGARPRYTS
jgi:hypothetical protein